jgi:hypothetical protein
VSRDGCLWKLLDAPFVHHCAVNLQHLHFAP